MSKSTTIARKDVQYKLRIRDLYNQYTRCKGLPGLPSYFSIPKESTGTKAPTKTSATSGVQTTSVRTQHPPDALVQSFAEKQTNMVLCFCAGKMKYAKPTTSKPKKKTTVSFPNHNDLKHLKKPYQANLTMCFQKKLQKNKSLSIFFDRSSAPRVVVMVINTESATSPPAISVKRLEAEPGLSGSKS